MEGFEWAAFPSGSRQPNPADVTKSSIRSTAQSGLDWGEAHIPGSHPGPGGRRPPSTRNMASLPPNTCVDKGSDLAMPGVGMSHGTHEPGEGHLGRKLPSL